MSDCSICAQKYTLSMRTKLECPKCRESFCRECLKNDIKTDKEGADNSIKCFFCGEEFSLDFLKELFGALFLKQVIIPKKELNNFISYQMAQLPSTQAYANFLSESETWKKEIRDPLQKRISILKRELRISQTLIRESKPVYQYESSQQNFKFKCPSKGCMGFVSETGECMICHKHFCTDCMEEKSEDHVCNSDTLESIALLQKDSKPCPHCGLFAVKTEGCNQMWCPDCKGFWDWATGKRIMITHNNHAHNPEYLDWERRIRGSNMRVDERACDQIPVWIHYRSLFQKNFALTTLFDHPVPIYQQVMNLTNLYEVLTSDNTEKYLSYRADYLNKKICKEQLLYRIKKLKMTEIKNTSLSEIIFGFRKAKEAILRNMLDISERNCGTYGKKYVTIRTDEDNIYYCYEEDSPELPEFKKDITDMLSQLELNYEVDIYYDREITKFFKDFGFKKNVHIPDLYRGRTFAWYRNHPRWVNHEKILMFSPDTARQKYEELFNTVQELYAMSKE